jgi:tetratricopeptide (TPR) repeat protein
MPMRERLQLTHALIGRLGGAARSEDIDWHGLLRFTGGNPLTIAVMIRQAVLRERVTTTAQVDAFVGRVEAGAAPLEPAKNSGLGRSASLAASLAYGFAHAFTDPERAPLALLHVFRDVVDVGVLQDMCNPAVVQDDAVAALSGIDRDSLTELLDRAAELGLLTEYGAGCYGIHPALRWFFTDLFSHNESEAATVERAYARAYATVSDCYFTEVEQGRAADVLPSLRTEEANLRHALHLARTRHLPRAALSCAQGLRHLYDLTGRTTEWASLVADIEGDHIDLGTDRPRPGSDDHYSLVTEYRVHVARVQRDWPTANRLQTARTAWNRERAALYVDLPSERLDPVGRHFLRELAASEQLLGALMREQHDPACRRHFHSAHDLNERIGDRRGQAIAASSLGIAHLRVPELRDLDQAHHWMQRSLDLTPEQDHIHRAVTYSSLANVAYERSLEARAAGARPALLAAHLEQARAGQQQALDLLPDDHHDYRATAHNQLGNIHSDDGDIPRALAHYQQSLHHDEARGDTFGAGRARFNIALLLGKNGRAGDALLYARAALANFQQVGPGAATAAAQTQTLIDMLEGILVDPSS